MNGRLFSRMDRIEMKARPKVDGNCKACPWRTWLDKSDGQLDRELRDMEIGELVCMPDDEIEDYLAEVFAGRFGLTFDQRARGLVEKLIEKRNARETK